MAELENKLYALIKTKYPQWNKIYKSEEQLRRELYNNICEYCEIDYEINDSSNIHDLLNTGCGSNFEVIYGNNFKELKEKYNKILVRVPYDEYNELIESKEKLIKLENAGVDN